MQLVGLGTSFLHLLSQFLCSAARGPWKAKLGVSQRPQRSKVRGTVSWGLAADPAGV